MGGVRILPWREENWENYDPTNMKPRSSDYKPTGPVVVEISREVFKQNNCDTPLLALLHETGHAAGLRHRKYGLMEASLDTSRSKNNTQKLVQDYFNLMGVFFAGEDLKLAVKTRQRLLSAGAAWQHKEQNRVTQRL